MAKLKNLRINNFKFFGNDNQIPPIEGKHVLVYGENGSGKSTLYWALYTLLEASAKNDAASIEKYFRKGVNEPHSLVNIHATQTPGGDFNAFVEAELDTGKKYRISHKDTDIRNDTQAQLSNLVTDFVNYRMLYKAYDFAHSEENDLYPLFEREVLPYVNFNPVEVSKDKQEVRASKILEFLWQGPGNTQNHKGDTILAPKNSAQYQSFWAKMRSFNSDLSLLLARIDVRGKEILQERFGYKNIEFKLELVQSADIDKKDKWFTPVKPKIRLSIPAYNGVSGLIHKPQTFLNEARLSALSLSIRLALLDLNFNTSAELKLLVLDDLLLSLDMSNRDKVVELLLNEYVHKYQILLFTHEFRFFEIAKKRIQAKGLKEDWLYWEMFVVENAGSPPRPVILPSESYLGKAKKYFDDFDFAAAGNYLRKEAEEFVKRFLPLGRRRSKEANDLPLEAMIKKAIEFGEINKLGNHVQTKLKALDEHRKFIFNPLSHDSFDVSMLKNDLTRAFETLAYLRKIESKTILKMGDQLRFELIGERDGKNHCFEIELCDELKLISESPESTPVLAKNPFYVKYFLDGSQVKSDKQEYNDLKEFFQKKYDPSDKSADPDFAKTMLLPGGLPFETVIKI